MSRIRDLGVYGKIIAVTYWSAQIKSACHIFVTMVLKGLRNRVHARQCNRNWSHAADPLSSSMGEKGITGRPMSVTTYVNAELHFIEGACY